MQRFLIKIGKVWSALRREGFLRTLRRVGASFATSFAPVGAGEVLFVTSGVGDSARYRGGHVAEELRLHGFQAATTTQDNPFLLRYIERFDVFILHRVSCTPRMERFVQRAAAAGKTVLFETDDLTFDAARMRQTNAYANMNSLERAQYSEGQGVCVLDASSVTHATTTTAPLARHLRQQGKDVFIVPNKLSRSDCACAEAATKTSEASPRNTVTLGYFSGSASHDRDFAVITDVLLDLFATHKNVHLLVVGPLTLDHRFDTYRDRISHRPYAPRCEHFANIAACDINLAPLEIGDAFCEAKSAIKFIEAGIVGVPTVASATEVFTAAVTDGMDGFVTHDALAWRTKLTALITNPEMRKEMGNAARTTTRAHYTTECAGNEAYYAFLRQTIGGIAAEDLTPLMSAPQDVDTAIVIANWNGKDHLRTCLDALRVQDDKHFVTIVVENGSEDGSWEMLEASYPAVARIRLSDNTGFAHANNVGISAALTDTHITNVIALNNDTKAETNFVGELRRAIGESDRTKIGALQSKVLNFYNRDRLDATGILTSCEMSAMNRGRGERDRGQYDEQCDIFGPSASAALYTREALEAVRLPHVGYFDRDYFAYYEDVDLAWRLQYAGYGARFVPEAIVWHVHSATGQNYSPFKAFHIHRNHYYNLLKDAPLLVLLVMVVVIPWRYALLLVSIVRKKGASAKLKERTDDHAQEEGPFVIAVRALRDVWRFAPTLLRKRRAIQPSLVRGHMIFWRVLRRHHIALKRVIFDS